MQPQGKDLFKIWLKLAVIPGWWCTLYEMGEVSFHLLQQKVFRLMLWSCRTSNFTSKKCKVECVQHDHFSSLNQSYHRFALLLSRFLNKLPDILCVICTLITDHLSMSRQAVCIKSLISLPLVIAFLKHSCNLWSGKGDPPKNKRKDFLN